MKVACEQNTVCCYSLRVTLLSARVCVYVRGFYGMKVFSLIFHIYMLLGDNSRKRTLSAGKKIMNAFMNRRRKKIIVEKWKRKAFCRMTTFLSSISNHRRLALFYMFALSEKYLFFFSLCSCWHFVLLLL